MNYTKKIQLIILTLLINSFYAHAQLSYSSLGKFGYRNALR